MTYAVKEIFYTLQGEGAHTGRPSVFCRFAGCNLWSGHESTRASAICQFCDTDFVGIGPDGGSFSTAQDLGTAVEAAWKGGNAHRWVVCTGGEPLLQLDAPLIAELHERGFRISIETNGTQVVPDGIDWVCVSPKARAPLVATGGDEMKLVFPQPDLMPEMVSTSGFSRLSLQPMDGPKVADHTRAAIDYCLAHPQWQLSLQTHKFVGIR